MAEVLCIEVANGLKSLQMSSEATIKYWSGPRDRGKISEAQIQSSCVMWLCNTHPSTRGLFFMAKNDGAKLSVKVIREAMEYIIRNIANPRAILSKANEILKYCKSGDGIGGAIQRAMGLIPGVSDCLFIWQGRVYCFEFKTETGRQSPAQIEWQLKVNKQGINYYLIRSLEQFKKQMEEIL